MTEPIDRWGPFAEGLGVLERRGRLQLLAHLVRSRCGSRTPDLSRLLVQAETDAAALEPALAALNALPIGQRQTVLAAYARLSEPASTMLEPPDQSADPVRELQTRNLLIPIEAALLVLVAGLETQPTTGPAMKAYRTGIRRKGEEARAVGGVGAMESVLRAVADAAPDRAERRERIIAEAWVGLPGWSC